jgi:hypothetical protein
MSDAEALMFLLALVYGLTGCGAAVEAICGRVPLWKSLVLLVAWPAVFIPGFTKWLARNRRRGPE